MADQMLFELQQIGVNINQALELLGDSEETYRYFLDKFLKDENYSQLLAGAESGDREAELAAAHTMKGMCGNLGMMGMYRNLDMLVSILRGKSEGDEELLVRNITEQYQKVCDVILQHMD